MNRPLKMLLPSKAPRLISSYPRNLATTAVASSGTDVPTATKVAPTTNSSLPNDRATPLAPRTMSLSAPISNSIPASLDSTIAHRRRATSITPAALRNLRASFSVAASHAKNRLSISAPSSLESVP